MFIIKEHIFRNNRVPEEQFSPKLFMHILKQNGELPSKKNTRQNRNGNNTLT